jgi:hypothetical protein
MHNITPFLPIDDDDDDDDDLLDFCHYPSSLIATFLTLALLPSYSGNRMN